MRKKGSVLMICFTILSLLIVTTACKGQEKLSIYNWSYYTPESVIEKFEEKYHVKVIYDEFASNEEMYAKIMTTTNREGILGRIFNMFARRYDIIFPSQDYASIMIRQDMLEKLDKSLLPNLVNIDPVLLEKITYDPQMNYAVPYYWGAAGIAVNTAKVPDYNKDWSIFGREDLRGRMTMLDDMRDVMGGALAQLNYSVNSKNPDEIFEARQLINTQWKPNLAKFDSETFGKGYANGDFWAVHAYAEVVFEEIADNEQLINDTVFFIPLKNGPAYIDNMCILKSSNNKELAHKFINFIHEPEIYAEFCDAFGLPSTANIPARKFKQGNSWYPIEDLYGRELTNDLGDELTLYSEAWFDSIRAGN